MTPDIITQQRQRLAELINKDDSPSLSIREVAQFLGMDYSCLLESINQGKCPFGVGGQNLHGNRFGKIFKLALWNYLTKGVENNI